MEEGLMVNGVVLCKKIIKFPGIIAYFVILIRMQPKILLADDHSMIRKGLRASFKFELGYTDVAEVSNCNELMKELKNIRYTHLILDINLSDGSSLEVLPNIKQLYPELKIAVLSMQPAAIYAKVL